MNRKETYLQDLNETKNLFQMVRCNSEYLQKLLEIVKDVYYCRIVLDESSSTVLLSATNIDINNPLGFLVDIEGKVFSIDAINDTNALITFRFDLSAGITEETFEELVKVTPTSCRLVNNEGKLELQLKHDSKVLDIDNHFPNALIEAFNDDSIKDIFIIDFDFSDLNGTTIIATGLFTSTNLITKPIASIQEVFRELNHTGLCGLVIVDGKPYSSMTIMNDKLVIGEYEIAAQTIDETYNIFDIYPFVSQYHISL